MTNYDEESAELERQRKEEAWLRLEAKLAEAEPSPRWAEWAEAERSRSEERPFAHANEETESPAVQTASVSEASEPFIHAGRNNKAAKRTGKRSWMKRHMLKVGTASAAAVLAAIIAIPSTNEALAALLNHFKMEEVVVVQESDLEQLQRMFFGDNNVVNKFGTFTYKTNGDYRDELTNEQMLAEFGVVRPDIDLKGVGKTQFSNGAGPSSEYTLKLNVDELNSTMRKLGADKLLPQSVDGKELKLTTGETLNLYYHEEPEDNGRINRSVSVYYEQLPTIKVDPSIDVQDALDTVARLPGLPGNIRTAIVQSARIEEGKLPYPQFTNGQLEKVTINGEDVYFERFDNNADLEEWSAFWISDGMKTSVYSNGIEDRQDVEQIVAEIIAHD
ncbi:hypothetical protein [Paenibacillus sp. NEAU-GSW1]|uniref:hypothetical protein n=1 Tax=Paenibacillus sp. NEAU-GSW1 TaxID=2682486 RepID=UPI0012E206CA|nr:hypothetical protein [Paenibacillus sp. NEAU-GSW1]MUT67810.1 hypothetical protein [Paenibacillus sp. NEAU-GSW1]